MGEIENKKRFMSSQTKTNEKKTSKRDMKKLKDSDSHSQYTFP